MGGDSKIVRLDVLLVEMGVAPSRTKAQDMLDEGHVTLNRVGRAPAVAKAPSLRIDRAELASGQVHIQVNSSLLKFVSRGGFKLEGALSKTGISVTDRVCIDVGQSTGGFTDCLLQSGSGGVLGVEVGEGQLHERLRNDARVVCLENLHVNKASSDPRVRAFLGEKNKFDLLVADLSFISLAKVIDDISRLADEYLILVKPQFELGPAALDRRGLVKDPALYEKLEADLRNLAATKGWMVCDYFKSCIQGKDGNVEFFMHSRRINSK